MFDIISLLERAAAFLRGLFTPEQWIKITNELVDGAVVLVDHVGIAVVVSVMVLVSTEAAKRFMRWNDSLPDPKNWHIHTTSFLMSQFWTAGLFWNTAHTFFQLLAISIFAWGLAVVLATIYYRKIKPTWFGGEKE